MTIEDRNLAAGTKLWANYKKTRYVCTVEKGDEGKLRFRVEGIDKVFASPSSAGMAVMDGKAVNGWRFWSLEGTHLLRASRRQSRSPRSAKNGRARRSRSTRSRTRAIRPKAQTRFFCTACMKSFTVEGADAPAACPEGHPMEDLNAAPVVS